jgi:hypothetical protein
MPIVIEDFFTVTFQGREASAYGVLFPGGGEMMECRGFGRRMRA